MLILKSSVNKSLPAYAPKANSHCLTWVDADLWMPIGSVWRDYEDLPWNYAIANAVDGRNAFYSWGLAKVLEELWAWKSQCWQEDIEWRELYSLPPNPQLSQFLEMSFDFAGLAKDGWAKPLEFAVRQQLKAFEI